MAVKSVSDSLAWAASLDSMEGIPSCPELANASTDRPWHATLQQRCYRAFENLGTLLPGLALALGLTLVSEALSQWLGTTVLGFAKSPIGAIPLIVLLGLVLGNLVGLPAVYQSGLYICQRYVMRFGIVLLGLRLSLAAVGQVGLFGLPIILACIAVALIIVTWVSHALALPRRLGCLIAVGTSICGVSAVVATAPVLAADEDELSYAVCCVTLFGTIALFFYPFLAYGAFAGDPHLAGIFLGTAIHDTSQVSGAGLMYQQQFEAPQALNTAIVTKLMRNLCMIGIIPLIAVLHRRHSCMRLGGARRYWHRVVPRFIVAFLALAAIRTLGDMGERPFLLVSKASWHHCLELADKLSVWCLAVAMAAVGMGTGLRELKDLGIRPFCVGLAAALLVGSVGMCLLKVLHAMECI